MHVTSSKPLSGPIVCVVGARPNFMKIAPIIDALEAAEVIDFLTG